MYGDNNHRTRKPWIGRHYGEKDFDAKSVGPKRLLVVGESFFGFPEDRDNPDLNIMVVESVMSGTRLPFFTKIEAAIRGCSSQEIDPGSFWEQVAFANFYQGAFPSPREKPREMERAMLKAGIRTFPTLLANLEPSRMLVFSSKVWNNLDKFADVDWTSTEPLIRDGKEIDNGYLTARDQSFKVYCTWIPHPAAPGWGQPARWTPVIREFMDRKLR